MLLSNQWTSCVDAYCSGPWHPGRWRGWGGGSPAQSQVPGLLSQEEAREVGTRPAALPRLPGRLPSWPLLRAGTGRAPATPRPKWALGGLRRAEEGCGGRCPWGAQTATLSYAQGPAGQPEHAPKARAHIQPNPSSLLSTITEADTGMTEEEATRAKVPLWAFSPLTDLVRQVVLPRCAKKDTQGQGGQGLHQGFRAREDAAAGTPSASSSRT